MSSNSRRKFLKSAVAVTAASMLGAKAAQAQSRSLLPRRTRIDRSPQALSINPDAVAIMPTGEIADRSAILQKLGLDPSTPPDAWLAIVACGSNASALQAGQIRELIDANKFQNLLDPSALGRLRTQPQ